jgi:hypothetical protein
LEERLRVSLQEVYWELWDWVEERRGGGSRGLCFKIQQRLFYKNPHIQIKGDQLIGKE